MIGLEYIVKLYKGTFKKLGEELGVKPSTVNDWLSKRRPIPKAKLEALSQLFNLDEELFQKELGKIEEIELELNYLKRVSKNDLVKIEEIFTDVEGKEYKSLRIYHPNERELQFEQDELRIKQLMLKLQGALYGELYELDKVSTLFQITERLKMVASELKYIENQRGETILDEKLHERLKAINSMMYWVAVKGSSIMYEDEESFHNELYYLLKKYDLLRKDEN